MPDPRVVNAIKRIARRRGMDMEAVLGALSTGLVESNLEELSGGDADSYGWRQQRESIYGRQGLNKSINNFFDEWEQHDRPGFNPGLTAANVQRPAEQYRGRYAEAMDQARRILGGDWSGGGGQDPSAGAVGSTGVGSPGENPFGIIASIYQPDPSSPYAGIMERGWDLLGQAWEQNNPGQAPPSSPAILGHAGGGGGRGKGIRGLQEAFYDPVGGYDAGQSIGAIGGHSDHMHFGGNPAAIRRIVRMAQKPKWNLNVREYAPVDPVDPVHTEGSWHYKHGGRGGADISGANMDSFFRKILRRAGWR